MFLAAAKGELGSNSAGRFTAVSHLAAQLSDGVGSRPPSVIIETKSRTLLIKDYDNMTMVLKSVNI
jgi:hypothetical protein